MSLPGEAVTDADLQPEDEDEVEEYGEEVEGEELGIEEDAAPADPFAEFGGTDSVKTAVAFHRHVQNADGALETFFQLGRSFGLGVREIEALFGGSQAAAEDEPQGPADDDVMTYAEFKRAIEQEVRLPLREQQMLQTRQAAQIAVHSTIKELGIEDDQTKAAILQLGDRYLDGSDLSPEVVANAVRRGHADFIALVQANADKYRAKKAAVARTIPKPVKGVGAPAGQVEAEPKDVKEAIARARRRLLG